MTESNNPFEPHAQYARGANAHQGTRRTSPLLILAVVLSSIALVASIAALFISFISLGSTTTSADSANTTDTVIEESDSAVDGDTTDTLETEEAASSESEWEGDSGNWHIEISDEIQTGSGIGDATVVMVSAEVTNIGSDNNSMQDITFTAWQNGYELNSGTPSLDSSMYELWDESLSDRIRTVQPNTTSTLTYFFKLEDTEGSFELEVYDSSSAEQIVTATFEL